MAKGHKPITGSRAFWPKKRAKRIYPRVKSVPKIEGTGPLVFAGYKAGMTHVTFLDNRKGSATQGHEVVKPVTVLDCPSLKVLGIKTYKKTVQGLKNTETIWTEKIPKDLYRKTNIPKKPNTENKLNDMERQLDELDDIRLLVCTQPRLSGIRKKKPELFEIMLGGDLKQKFEYAKQKIGSEIRAEDVFKPGEFVDVKSVTKGKGYQGPVKRFGIKIRSRKDKGKIRHVGTLGPRNVARILPGKLAMAGQLGFQTRTEYNKMILKMGSEKINPKGGWINYGLISGDYILLQGSVPGPRKRLVILRKGIRSPSKIEPVEIKDIYLDSQQGV
jgi:large subunit ribosomal protein L3